MMEVPSPRETYIAGDASRYHPLTYLPLPRGRKGAKPKGAI